MSETEKEKITLEDVRTMLRVLRAVWAVADGDYVSLEDICEGLDYLPTYETSYDMGVEEAGDVNLLHLVTEVTEETSLREQLRVCESNVAQATRKMVMARGTEKVVKSQLETVSQDIASGEVLGKRVERKQERLVRELCEASEEIERCVEALALAQAEYDAVAEKVGGHNEEG